MGFPTDMFPVLFAIPRTAGWLAHWNELLDDPENKIVRPRQVYAGVDNREYVSLEERNANVNVNLESYASGLTKRRLNDQSV